MKKIIGVALFFLLSAAPALAGGSASSGGFHATGGTFHSSQPSGGFGLQPARSFAPPTRVAPPTREAPKKYVAEDPLRKHPRLPEVSSVPYDTSRSACPKNPYIEPVLAVNECAVNPWVLYAFPSADY